MNRVRQTVKLAVLAFPLSFIIGKILNRIIINPRPFVVEGVQPLIAHTADNGFPSDHTLLAATIASVVWVYNKKLGWVLFGVALIIGAVRVWAKVHHPIDIAGSILIAISATGLAFFIMKKKIYTGKNA